MTDARQTPPSAEEQMLTHLRQHRVGEPPASLDALILASARREVPAPAPSLWQRWLNACQKPRWQMAFASLFGVALILTWVQRSPEPYPTPMLAPAPAPAAAPAAPLARLRAESAPAELAGALSAPAAPAPVAPMGRFAASPQAEMLMDEAPPLAKPSPEPAQAKMAKRAAAPAKPLDQQLREVLRLRKDGQAAQADALLAALHKRYPQEDLNLRMKALKPE
jgi:hypothetical protein